MPGQFAIAFRQHVIPRLRTRAAVNACMAALRIWDWHRAYDDCLALACEHGAKLLDDATWHELEDWIAAELTAKTEELARVIR